MTVIYIDSLFILNLVINYFLLLATANIAGVPFSRLRLALGAVLGAAYAVLVWLPGLRFLSFWLMKLVFGLLIVLMAFAGKSNGRLFRLGIIFTCVSFALGGTVFAISLLSFGETAPGGIPYLPVDSKTLILTAGISYGLLSVVFRKSGKHAGAELKTVTVSYKGRDSTFTALADSGHTLTDPHTGEPVLVINAQVLPSILGFDLPTSSLNDPTEAYETLGKSGVPFRLLPYRAIGVDCGFLLAFKPSSVTVGKKKHINMLVAISPTELSEGAGYEALIGV